MRKERRKTKKSFPSCPLVELHTRNTQHRNTTDPSLYSVEELEKNMNDTTTNSAATASTELKNVWDAPRNTPSVVGKKDYSEEHPFGSSYYFAHNNSKATGGYKDGLKMEDYTMNGPRLLSKGGKPVESSTSASANNAAETTATATADSKKPAVVAHDPNLIKITKYLWDDSGDANGVATIRIDSLPQSTGSTAPLVEFKQLCIAEAKADFLNPETKQGLLVELSGDETNEKRYQLKIPNLFGEAESVRAVLKTKRLLVKIQKKASPFTPKDSGSTKESSEADDKDSPQYETWPHPHKKA